MIPIFRTATILFGLLTLLTGVGYPLAVTAIAQIAFPSAANGSLLTSERNTSWKASEQNWRDGSSRPTSSRSWAGSELIGQNFRQTKYFWGRPSSTAPFAYNASSGSGSNQATSNPMFLEAVRTRVSRLQSEDPENHAAVPVDLVTSSASGLDPHISEAAAMYQVARIARVRKMESDTVNRLVLSHLERPTFGILGQSRVNVLKLNLALDAMIPDVAPEAKSIISE